MPALRIVVVGNGMAGWKLCRELVAAGLHERAAITVFGEEPRPAYDRVRLTSLFAGRQPEDLLLAPREWYAGHRIALVTGDPVIAIDRERRNVTTRRGVVAPYDRLVLATGSRPFVPPMRGSDAPGVFVYRTIEDIAAIRTYARGAKTAAVIGGGLLGLEAAQALLNLGLATTVIERAPGLMARQLTPASAELLRRKVGDLGVNVLLKRETLEARPREGGGVSVVFRDCEPLDCDLLIIAAGIRPRQELAESCGLPCDRRGGIVVDDQLATADPNILAIGECAAHRGTIYGLAAPGFLMAGIAAARLAGKNAAFTGTPLSARLKLLAVDVAVLGEFQENGDSFCHVTPTTHRELVFRRGRLVGAISVGPNPEIARLHDAVERRRRVFPWRRSRFARTGLLWNDEAGSHPGLWPASTIVCNCKVLTRGALSAACQQGCRSVEDLARTTGASTVCGSCRPLLTQIAGVAETAAKPVAGRRTLLAVCAAAAALALGVGIVRPIVVGTSVEHAPAWHVLLTEPSWRRVTGFVVLGLASATLLLSLRKRIRRFAWGDLGWWRVLHASLGVAGVAGIIAHTGFRLGNNFNRLLMLDFLGLVLLGTLAGAVVAIEQKLDLLAARRLRAFWTWAHLVFVWPLPVLLLFHVLSAYYY